MKNHCSSLRGFSLVEMLMALLVASLLLAALAPVMTRKINHETITVNGNMSAAGGTQIIREIEYNSEDCSEIKTDSDGSTYCEGEFVVPGGYNGYINVTVIGAGGGGGTAPTAGYTEYTTAANHTFPVPAMVGNIEATLVSGGAGGGAGGQIKILKEFTTPGNNTFNVPNVLKNNYALVDICGGGGAGGRAAMSSCWPPATYQGTGGGGSGGYYQNKYTYFPGDATVQVYVGAAGTGPAYFWDGIMWSTTRVDFSKGNGANAEDGSGGAGGGTNNPRIQGRIGGKGGHSSGGQGGAYLGDCGLVGGGGGGGGASRLCVSGQSCYLYTGGGGGGGGEAIRIMENGGIRATLSGGGGGGGGGTGLGGNGGGSNELDYGCHAYGGSGGRPGGNGGGTSGCNNANPATSGAGGNSPLTKYQNYCAGGHGEGYNGSFNSRRYGGAWNGTNPRPAKNGIVAITYLDYGPGGSGGGSGHIVPLQKVNVNQKENLNIKIGTGGAGGAAGAVKSNGTIADAAIGQGSNTNVTPLVTKISRNSTAILSTPDNAGHGVYGGSPTGQSLGNSIGPYYACKGLATIGNVGIYTRADLPDGFSATNGKTAGNGTTIGNTTYANNTIGGDGGTLTTPWSNCIPGKGGTKIGEAGGNATGYGGCGGGGGYGLAKGGNGAPGYARISWNKYWDTITNAYKLAETGAGGGGASGNVFTYSFEVKSNQVIKFKIGKGGSGAYIANNALINAAKGGDTVFGDVKAGGGGGGASVSVNPANNEPVNGSGGSISNICHFGTVNYLNNKKCIKGLSGNSANLLSGGKGADFNGYTITLVTKEGDEKTETKKEIKGEGGTGGTVDTGDNANGKNAEGYASGGGGASLRDMGQVNSSSTGNITNNQNRGGNGANGKIILEWWE